MLLNILVDKIQRSMIMILKIARWIVVHVILSTNFSCGGYALKRIAKEKLVEKINYLS